MNEKFRSVSTLEDMSTTLNQVNVSGNVFYLDEHLPTWVDTTTEHTCR